MDTLPAIGARVRYAGSRAIGPCVGTVIEHSPDFDLEELEALPFMPDTWHVSVEVETLPDPWPYSGNRFAPRVSEVEPA